MISAALKNEGGRVATKASHIERIQVLIRPFLGTAGTLTPGASRDQRLSYSLCFQVVANFCGRNYTETSAS